MTHRDGLPRFSARSVPGGHGGCPPGYINAGGAPATPGRGDPGSAGGFAEASAGHREACATLSANLLAESLGKQPFRSSMRPVEGRRKALTMPRIAWPLPSYPTGRMDDPYGSLSPLLGITTGTG